MIFVLFLSGLLYTEIPCDTQCGAYRFFSIFFVNGSGQGLVMGAIGLASADRIKKKRSEKAATRVNINIRWDYAYKMGVAGHTGVV